LAYAGRQRISEVVLWRGEDSQANHSSSVAATLLDPSERFVWSRWQAEIALKPGRNVLNVSCVDRSGRFSTVLSNEAPAEPDGWGGVHRLVLHRT
jgi:hypothetical protein